MTTGFFPHASMSCCICLEELHHATSDDVATLACTHQFHQACLQSWMAHGAACPLCRRPVDDRTRSVLLSQPAPADRDLITFVMRLVSHAWETSLLFRCLAGGVYIALLHVPAMCLVNCTGKDGTDHALDHASFARAEEKQ